MFACRKNWTQCILPSAIAIAVAIAPLTLPTEVYAQGSNSSLAEARSHYKKGSALFAQGNFQAAIGEFASADKLSPSPLLQYNIALCYDRLGDNAEALRRYRVYLKEAGNVTNREAVESKIKRLEGVLRSEAEERRITAAAIPAPVPTVTPTIPIPTPTPTPSPAVPPVEAPLPAGTDSISEKPVYKPGGVPDTASTAAMTGEAKYTGTDPGLVRVSAIDVAAIRDQRGLVQFSGASAAGEPGAPPPNAATVPPPESDSGDGPFYKQWWFWVVAGVGAVVLYSIASTDDSSQNQPGTRLLTLPMSSSSSSFGAAPGGLEWRF